MSDPLRPERSAEQQDLLETKKKTRVPPRYRVLLHNDDYTTMDFVVDILQRIFHRPPPEATRIMLDVHYRGIGLAGIYPREVAETKVSQVTEEALALGMPLLATAEPESVDP